MGKVPAHSNVPIRVSLVLAELCVSPLQRQNLTDSHSGVYERHEERVERREAFGNGLQ